MVFAKATTTFSKWNKFFNNKKTYVCIKLLSFASQLCTTSEKKSIFKENFDHLTKVAKALLLKHSQHETNFSIMRKTYGNTKLYQLLLNCAQQEEKHPFKKKLWPSRESFEMASLSTTGRAWLTIRQNRQLARVHGLYTNCRTPKNKINTL